MTDFVGPDYCQRAQRYDSAAANQTFYRFWAELSLESLPAAIRPSRVLEVGCGSGISTIVYRSKFPDCEFHALDRSRNMLQLAEQKVETGTVKFHCSQAEALPLANSSVDLILSSFAFHWFRPSDALDEMQRVLRSGGQLILLVPSTSGPLAVQTGNRLLRQRLLRSKREFPRLRTPSIGLDRDTLCPLLERAGLEAVSFTRHEFQEVFPSATEMWQLLESRGSLHAIFGDHCTPENAFSEPEGPVEFLWRALSVSARSKAI